MENAPNPQVEWRTLKCGETNQWGCYIMLYPFINGYKWYNKPGWDLGMLYPDFHGIYFDMTNKIENFVWKSWENHLSRVLTSHKWWLQPIFHHLTGSYPSAAVKSHGPEQEDGRFQWQSIWINDGNSMEFTWTHQPQVIVGGLSKSPRHCLAHGIH